jgi:hypothetical protein
MMNLVKGQKFKVLTDYNGQPFGKSSPSLKGKIFAIKSPLDLVFIDGTERIALKGGYIDINKVEFLDN